MQVRQPTRPFTEEDVEGINYSGDPEAAASSDKHAQGIFTDIRQLLLNGADGPFPPCLVGTPVRHYILSPFCDRLLCANKRI